MSNIFDAFENDERWLGFGYLGGRYNALSSTDPEVPALPRDLVEAIDDFVIFVAEGKGWDDEQLFAWANSRNGRWFSDSVFYGFDIADLPKVCERAERLIKQPA